MPTAFFKVADPIRMDLACAFCGYNLRTRRLSDICPECGKPVEQTITRLLWTDQRWARNITRGASLLLAGATGAGLWLSLWLILGPSFHHAESVIALGLVVLAGATLRGAWLIAAPNPHPVLRQFVPRVLVRLAIALLVCGVGLFVLCALAGIHLPRNAVRPYLAVRIAFFGLAVFVPVLLLWQIAHLLRIARSAGLARLAGLLACDSFILAAVWIAWKWYLSASLADHRLAAVLDLLINCVTIISGGLALLLLLFFKAEMNVFLRAGERDAAPEGASGAVRGDRC